MNGYFDFKSTNGFVTDAWVTEVNKEECGFTVKCQCCNKTLNKWLSVNYIDEYEQEIEEVYGITCFKKIATKSNAIAI